MARGGPARSAASRSTATRSGSASAPRSCSGSSTGGGLLSLRNLDLLVLLSFSVSLWFFNRGDVFTAMPLVYPGARLAARALLWIGCARPRAARRDGLAGLGARRGDRLPRRLPDRAERPRLERDRRRLRGRDRRRPDLRTAQSPYGNFPVEEDLPKCGPADAAGEVRERIQTNGRCETANAARRHVRPRLVRRLPARATASSAGAASGTPARRPRDVDPLGPARARRARARRPALRRADRLAATLAFAWVAWPFTQYASSSNTNDLIQPALLDLGLLLRELARARGGFARARRRG